MNEAPDQSRTHRLRSRLNTRALAAGDPAASAVDSHELNFDMLEQIEDNWCWAAVGSSVSNFLDQSGWAVCSFVNHYLNRSDCCNQPVPAPCDQTQVLSKVLRSTNNFAGWARGSDNSLAVLESRIAAGRPVPIQINVTANKTHFAVVYGYVAQPQATMLIRDPEGSEYAEPIGDTITHYGSQAEVALLYFTQEKDES